ncbi:MAG: hypothetical protein AMJ45_04100, partial [Syntrophobacter sp. DG_60]
PHHAFLNQRHHPYTSYLMAIYPSPKKGRNRPFRRSSYPSWHLPWLPFSSMLSLCPTKCKKRGTSIKTGCP